ncbi:MAG: methionine adenosyltransferase [Candidatus Krumholzibacteriia bacterium]
MAERHLFTSESVTEGHPDKVADQISDSVVDAILTADPQGRVACETLVTTGIAFVAGEITTKTYVDIPRLVRETIRDIGYTSADFGFDYATCAVVASIDEQSPDIAQGVNPGGAGDQGLMFGYACRETDVLMPLPITMAHHLALRLAQVRREGILPWVRPDGKTQVTIAYEGTRPVAVDTIVVSTQHGPDVSNATLRAGIAEQVIRPVLARFPIRHDGFKTHINPTGRFVVGGPQGDCGLTGRKIIVDTYGGAASHGGGAFSGKDPTKVDRSACYAARHVAKNVVAAGLAERCLVQLAYAIGVAEPVSVMIDTAGTGKVPDARLRDAVVKTFDLTPAGIIERLRLRRGIYRKTAAYGHFGREEPEFTWELTDLVEPLQSAVG